MNELEKELLFYKYKNEEINKWIKIYFRTKNKRIKNKQFVKILIDSVKERKTIKCEDIVLLDINVYNELNNKIAYYENLLKNIGDK